MGGGTGFGIRGDSGRALSLGSNGNWDYIVINTSGNVGIGETAPSDLLHIKGAASTNQAVAFRVQNTNASGQASITLAAQGVSVNTNLLMTGSSYFPYGALGAGMLGLYHYNTGIVLMADGNGYIDFASGGNTSRMRLTSGGNLGIGTTSPSSKLEVNGVVRDQYGDLRTLPENAKTAAYTLAASDTGRLINITTGGITVPASVFSVGQVVTIYNNSASNQTITQGASVTMYLSGTATTGNRTLAQRGVATVICVASNTFVISGSGLT
jgi:hypothetical protein